MLYPEQLKDMVNQCIERFGSVDVLVNNAGIQHVSSIETFPKEKWNEFSNINLNAVFLLTNAVSNKDVDQE